MEMNLTTIKAFVEQEMQKTHDIDTQIKLQQLWLNAYQQITFDCIFNIMAQTYEDKQQEDSTVEIKKIGEVGVDSGSVWIGDPCYFWENGMQSKVGTWQEASAKFLGTPYPKRYNFDSWGVMAATALGDGVYPVYAEIEGEVITKITIDFLADGDGDEEED